MLFSLSLGIGLTLILTAFFAEYIDSSLGMGYGTTLTPLLILFGFEPMQIVPAVLLSELVTGILAGVFHHSVGNVNFGLPKVKIHEVPRKIIKHGLFECVKRGIPFHLRIVLVIASCSILGTVAAVFLAVSLPKYYLKLYIGVLVLLIGTFILITINRNYRFSWKKITVLGLIAAFNKGMSGGGYGPVVTGGQLLAGIEGKNAIGITSLAEGLTCIVGVLVYLIITSSIDWSLAPYLLIGAVFSVPLSANTVKKINTNRLRLLIGFVTVALGIFTLWKVLF